MCRDVHIRDQDEPRPSPAKTEIRCLQVSRCDQDIEMHVVINACLLVSCVFWTSFYTSTADW